MPYSDPNRIFEGKHPVAERRALRTIAIFEAIKGITALAAIIGVFNLMNRDVRHLAIELIGRFGFNPDARYPSLLLHYAELLPGANVRLIVFLAFGYILVRMLEAYGLWNDRAWGEWLGALSGAIYIPFEISHLIHRPTVTIAVVLASNIFVVTFLVHHLRLRRKIDVARQ